VVLPGGPSVIRILRWSAEGAYSLGSLVALSIVHTNEKNGFHEFGLKTRSTLNRVSFSRLMVVGWIIL
jgi:hypothetical protein